MKTYEDPYNPSLIAEQDQAMSRFLEITKQAPRWTKNPDKLENELWHVGRSILRAVEGFVRLNPEVAVCDTSVDDYETVRHENPYKKWILSQASPDERVRQDSFLQLTTHHNEVRTTLSLNEHGENEVFIKQEPDAFVPAHVSQAYSYLHFGSTAGLVSSSAQVRERVKEAAVLGVDYGSSSPDYEYSAFGAETKDTLQVVRYLGEKAADVYSEHGQVGLFQYGLWHGMNAIANGLQHTNSKS